MEKKFKYLDRFEKFYESYKDSKEEVESKEETSTEEMENVENSDEELADFEEIDEKNFIKRFMKGATDEEIEAKAKDLEEKLRKMAESGKDKGYEVVFKNRETDDKFVDLDIEKALKSMEKNNFLGTLKAIPKGEKLNIVYTPGKKGMAKLGTGTGSQTAGK